SHRGGRRGPRARAPYAHAFGQGLCGPGEPTGRPGSHPDAWRHGDDCRVPCGALCETIAGAGTIGRYCCGAPAGAGRLIPLGFARRSQSKQQETSIMFGKHLLRHLLAGAAILAASQVGANEQPITFLVGFPPGGSTDTMARVVGEQVAKTLDRAVVVENRPGAGGRVAALALKNSAPDGNTYLVMPNASAVFNHLLYDTETLGYDLLSDMRPVAVFASGP